MMGGPAAEDTAAVLKHPTILTKILVSQCLVFSFFLSVVGYLVTGGKGQQEKKLGNNIL